MLCDDKVDDAQERRGTIDYPKGKGARGLAQSQECSLSDWSTRIISVWNSAG